MADQLIRLRIPSDKVAKALMGFLKTHPNIETKDDPAWVDPVDPEDESEAPQVPKYTNAQWVTEKMRRIVTRDCRRGNQLIANESALVAEDDDMVEIVE